MPDISAAAPRAGRSGGFQTPKGAPRSGAALGEAARTGGDFAPWHRPAGGRARPALARPGGAAAIHAAQARPDAPVTVAVMQDAKSHGTPWRGMFRLFKRLEPHAGGFIVRISAAEADALGLRGGDALEVQLWHCQDVDASLLKR